MSIEGSTPLVTFLTEIMDQKRCSPSQLATDLGVPYSTVHRWLHNKTLPTISSCRRLAEYTCLSLRTVFSRIDYIPPFLHSHPNSWPEFREYTSKKYPDELDDDLITLIEDLIAVRRDRIRCAKTTDKGTTKRNLGDKDQELTS
jgi:transcriptional regulator with XRE-family HTH domain